MAEETGQGEPGEQGQAGVTRPWFPPSPGGFPPEPWEQPSAQPSGPGPYGQPVPYGGPGPYGPPPYGRPAAPKPGIIPLRPIGVGEILDGAFTAVRRNPRATLGVGALIMTIYGIVAAIIAPTAVAGFGTFGSFSGNSQQSQARLQHDLSNFGHQIAGLAVTYLLLVIAGQILTGMLTVVVGRSVLGEQITAAEAWRRTLPRLPSIFGATILFCLVMIGLWAVFAGIGLIVAAVHAPVGLIAGYFVLGGIAVLCLTVWLWTSFVLANQVVVLERTGPARALGRSWRLVRGSFWRVLGIALLAELIAGIASAILQLPFSIPAGIIASHAGGSLHPPLLAVVIGTIGTTVSRSVTGALLAGIYVLLYVDLRMRKEGLDMALRTAADPGAPGAAGGDEFATVWRPPSAAGKQGPGHGQW